MQLTFGFFSLGYRMLKSYLTRISRAIGYINSFSQPPPTFYTTKAPYGTNRLADCLISVTPHLGLICAFFLRIDLGLELRFKLRLNFCFQIGRGLLGSCLSCQLGSNFLSSQFFGLRLFASPALIRFLLFALSALMIFTSSHWISFIVVHEHVPTGVGENPLVKASGIMPDGRKFANSVQFKQLLLEDRDQIARAFIEHLCTYALRRVLTVDDREDVQSIVEQSKQGQYRVKGIIRAVASSELLQKR